MTNNFNKNKELLILIIKFLKCKSQPPTKKKKRGQIEFYTKLSFTFLLKRCDIFTFKIHIETDVLYTFATIT